MELILIRGLPGSGKTTMAKVLAQIGFDHHEADRYFERDGEYKFDAVDLHKAHAACLENTIASMRLGRNCVVSNTFTRHWEMGPYIDVADKHGYRVQILTAKGNWSNNHGVPDDAVERMRSRWEI